VTDYYDPRATPAPGAPHRRAEAIVSHPLDRVTRIATHCPHRNGGCPMAFRLGTVADLAEVGLTDRMAETVAGARRIAGLCRFDCPALAALAQAEDDLAVARVFRLGRHRPAAPHGSPHASG